MNPVDDDDKPSAAPATRRVKGEAGFSPIWIVPIVALLIGAYLIYKVISEAGPEITITFEDAPGIEVGKTPIKYKDITVGQVVGLDMSDDIQKIVVTAEMSPKAEKYLTENTKFWIVQAQISGSGISGLSTLLSGNYIGMDPADAGKPAKRFVGLETQPVVHSREAGSQYALRAKRLGGVDIGSPVFYKDIPVGEVIDYKLQENGELRLRIFVRQPYDKKVNAATRFWNASGIDVSLTANGLEVNTESLVSILAGGVSFDTVAHLGKDASQPPAADRVFNLYPSREKSLQPSYEVKRRVLLYFTDSIRGLLAGAPVEMRGYQIGQVVDVDMEYDREAQSFRIPVLIEIEPQRIIGGGVEDFDDLLSSLVGRGLRGQLKSGNLVLGKLLVALDFHPNVSAAEVDFSGKYPVVPTVQDTYTALADNASALISELRQTGETLNAFLASPELKTGAADLSLTLANVKDLTVELEQSTAPELAKVLSNAAATLSEAQSMLATNATTRTEINRLLSELAQAARSIRLLADYLERHPESIIKGKNK